MMSKSLYTLGERRDHPALGVLPLPTHGSPEAKARHRQRETDNAQNEPHGSLASATIAVAFDEVGRRHEHLSGGGDRGRG